MVQHVACRWKPICIMLRNYLITAFRNFSKNRFYVSVNIFGLAIGMSCCLVVYSILKHELTFDSWHKSSSKIYRVVNHYAGDFGMDYSGILPNPMPEAIAYEMANVEAIPLLGPIGATVEFDLHGNYQVFQEGQLLYANEKFLTLLDFPILRGAPASVLKEPFKVYLTESKAKKYFGEEDPIGKTITIEENIDLEVVGIVSNPPTNTSAPFDLIVSFPTIEKAYNSFMKNWKSNWAATCYVLAEPSDVQALESQITAMALSHKGEEAQLRDKYFLQPMSEVHTDAKYGDAVSYVAPAEVLIGFILLGSITLIASILNFINLATAQAVKRAKEIGIRKTLGSQKKHLVFQFLGETLILVVLSATLAFTIGQVFMNKMNEFLTEVSFFIQYDMSSVFFAVLLVLFVTLTAGFYPSMVISSYSPITALKTQVSLKGGTGKFWLRKGLVISQFVIANLLIVSTVIVSSQMNYINKKDLGFNSENVMTVSFPSKLSGKMETIRSEFLKENFVEKASISRSFPQGGNWGTSFEIPGKATRDDMHSAAHFIDENFLDFYEIPIIAGRNLINKYTSDTTMQLLVSREFAKVAEMSVEEIVGTDINFLGSWKGKIIGVTEDFHNSSLQSKIEPVIMMHKPSIMHRVNLKLASSASNVVFNRVEALFRDLSPTGFYSGSVVEDDLQESYLVENLVHGVFQIFSVLAVLIGVFGLYGLVSFMAARNNKSISIKKVFGASTVHIILTFVREFGGMMTVAFLIATPISYLLAREWLNGFEYQIPITLFHFIIGLLITALITATTIGYRSWKAATANPVDSLRNE